MPSTPLNRSTSSGWNPLSLIDRQSTDDATDTTDEPSAYLLFKLAGQVLAVRVASVREILDVQQITPLPRAPMGIEGVIDVRGKGIAIFDLAGHLGLRGHADDMAGRIVVFEFDPADGPPLSIGVRTEDVRDVCEIPHDCIEPAPETLQSWDHAVMEGITRRGDDMVVVVNLAAVFGTGAAAKSLFDFA